MARPQREGVCAGEGVPGGALWGTHRRPREGHVVTVLLPRLAEAPGKVLEESVGLIEDGKSQDVDTVIREAIHSLE